MYPVDLQELLAEIDRLRAENEKLKNKGVRGLSLKVSEKGAVSLYGIGRFPVTLCKEQWAKILGMADEIEYFIRENDHLLKATIWRPISPLVLTSDVHAAAENGVFAEFTP
jgi:hypothetical protein